MAKDARVAIYFDCKPQAAQLPPERNVPWCENNKNQCHQKQRGVARSDMRLLVFERDRANVVRLTGYRIRNYDPGLKITEHGGPERLANGNIYAVDLNDGPKFGLSIKSVGCYAPDQQ